MESGCKTSDVTKVKLNKKTKVNTDVEMETSELASDKTNYIKAERKRDDSICLMAIITMELMYLIYINQIRYVSRNPRESERSPTVRRMIIPKLNKIRKQK